MSNMFSVEFNRTPKYTTDGHVSYSSEEYEGSEYSSLSSNRINSFAYNGYWYFALPGNNTITFNPRYAYTNTQQNSRYEENGAEAIVNGAKDNSHQLSATLLLCIRLVRSARSKLCARDVFC